MSDWREARVRMGEILAQSPLSVADYEAAVACVARAATDDEVAHGMQDRLVEHALRDIAVSGIPGSDAQGICAAVVKVFDIDFARWCA